MIKFVDMFSGIGGFREGLTRAGGFECVGHCEIDKYANRSYNALFDTKGEWFIEDARKADPSTMPDFQLLCGGFPCQTFSIAGTRKGFGDPRGTLFFELARLAEARKPPYLLFENVVGLINHDHCRTFATILNTLDRLGYGVEWQCLNSKDFGVPQSRNRVYIVGYLDERCRGKVFPFTETTGGSLIQTHGGHQGERVYSPEGLSCTLAANPGGFGGKTGLYEVGVPIKCATKTGYQMAQVGDSIDLSYATVNSRRGRVGKEIAHVLTGVSKKNTGQLPQYYIENNHEGIVTKQMFREVQAEIARRNSKSAANQRKRHQGRYNSKYALSERLVCGDCGSPYKRVTWNIHGRKQIVWRCVNRLEYGTKFCSHSPSIPEEELHQAILKAVQNLAANFTDEVAAQLDGILRQMKAGENLKAQLQKQLEKAQQEFDRLLEMSLELDESTPFLDDKLRKLSGKIKILKANIAESTDGKGEDEEATKQLTAQDLLIKEYDDILTARIIEKVIVHSRQEIEIYFIGGYTQKIDLI